VRPQEHRRSVGNPLLGEPKFCSSCHTQFMDTDMNSWGWVKMQDDYGAWLTGPFSKQNEENFSNERSVRCQDCHMALVPSRDPSANFDGKVRSHQFPAANTMLPTLSGDEAHLNAITEFLQANRMRVSIDTPTRSDSFQTLQSLDEGLRDFEEAPFFLYLGETARIQVLVSNNGVGHNFPGGTIDINEAWLEVLAMDATGERIFVSGRVGEDRNVDPQAHFYRSLPVDRTGQLVWRHDLFRMVGESFRRVIAAGESDVVEYAFRVPAWAKSPLTVTATLKYRKLNDRYARWALKDQYAPLPVVDLAWDSLAIPVEIRKRVEPAVSAPSGSDAKPEPERTASRDRLAPR
jgi:hypothetical protein